LQGLTLLGNMIKYMPNRNTRRIYAENTFYHIYNRGVEKRIIFKDEKDYKVFLSYIKEYLLSRPEISPHEGLTLKGQTFTWTPRQPKNYHDRLELHAYCLMPNHFHLLIKQMDKSSIKEFMQSLGTRYIMYFNKRYNRVGSLFQGRYKTSIVNNDSYILHLSRYIHLNPSEYTDDLANAYSSYGDYLGQRNTKWVKTEFILKYFSRSTNPMFNRTNSYKDFVENHEKNSKTILGKLTLE